MKATAPLAFALLLVAISVQSAILVDNTTPGFYNDSLGTVLDGSQPQFPLPYPTGGDPLINPAAEPNLAPAAAVLGDWLAPVPARNSNWRPLATIPVTWAVNTETAIMYEVDAGQNGITNLIGDFDADNGLSVWVNGIYKFGAIGPGLPSAAGQFEYTNIVLGSLSPGINHIQVLRQDNGIATGFQIRITAGAAVVVPPAITQHPSSRTATVGQSATFNVTATGTAPLSYQWRFNGDAIANATNNSLALLNVQWSHAGSYSVTVSNAAGSVTSSNAVLQVTTQPAILVDSTTPGYYNGSLGTILDGTQPQFPRPYPTGGDPLINPAAEPNLAPAATVLGDWLAPVPARNSNWRPLATIPVTWTVNTETAIIYEVDAGQHGMTNLLGSFDADNGLFVWVNGIYKFGAIGPGSPSPAGQFEYTNVVLGSLSPGLNYIQVLRQDNGFYTGYQVRITGTVALVPPAIAQQPTSRTVTVGESAFFAVTATGTAPLSYQWRFKGEPIANATNLSLLLLDVQLSHAGSYSVTVSNVAGSVTSSNAALHVNRAPIASVGATELLIISATGSNAVAVLDGTQSSDPDGDVLAYAWYYAGDANAFAASEIAVQALPLGTNHLVLAVSDGLAMGRRPFIVEVVIPVEAIERLVERVQSGAGNAQPLVASLRAALAALARGLPETGINQLEAFKNKVLAQVMPIDPALGAQLLADAQAIIDALNGGALPTPAPLEITWIGRGQSDKPRLKIKGLSGRIHVVEASSDLVNWQPAGVATQCGGCEFEFDDLRTSASGPRFYRVVSPR